jgi:hypothetical protein
MIFHSYGSIVFHNVIVFKFLHVDNVIQFENFVYVIN